MSLGKKGRDLIFYYFRYQLEPISNATQTTVDQYMITSYDDLRNKKNKIFADVLNSEKILLQGRSADYVYKVLSVDANSVLLRIARKKDISVEREDFTEETIVTYPNVLVLIDNRPNSLQIIIQHNHRAFDTSEMVANVLEKNFSRYLKTFQLSFYLKPITERNEFWELAKSYEDRISQITFDIIKTGLQNISSALNNIIHDLQQTSNTHKMKIELTAGKDAILENITSENIPLSNLIDYANDGGGEISIKVRGVRKKIHTNKHVVAENVDEISIKGSNPDQLKDILKVALIQISKR